MRLTTLALCLALIAVSGAALADRPSPEDNVIRMSQAGSGSSYRSNVQHSFGELDTDKNGYLSVTEASRAPMAASFGSLDRNFDGLLSREEYKNQFKDH